LRAFPFSLENERPEILLKILKKTIIRRISHRCSPTLLAFSRKSISKLLYINHYHSKTYIKINKLLKIKNDIIEGDVY
jgi:hypothetical protein